MVDEKKANAEEGSVTHIRRVDITEKSESTGNGEYCYIQSVSNNEKN